MMVVHRLRRQGGFWDSGPDRQLCKYCSGWKDTILGLNSDAEGKVVRERWSRWGDRRNWEFSAVAMLSKVSLGLGGDGGWCLRWWEWILRVNLMQVRQAALLNCLLVVFMGDLNWWESASVFLLFLKALYTLNHPSIPNPTQSHQSHFNMAPPGATPSLMKTWNPARSNFYSIKSQVYWEPNFNNFAPISTAEHNF